METKDCPCPPAVVFTIYGIIFPLTGSIIYAGHTTHRDVSKRIKEHGQNREHMLYQAFHQVNLHPPDMEHIVIKEIPFYGTIRTPEYHKWRKDCLEQEKKYIQFLVRTQKDPVYNQNHNPNWINIYGEKSPDQSFYFRDKGKVKRVNKYNDFIIKMIANIIRSGVAQDIQKFGCGLDAWRTSRIQRNLSRHECLFAPRNVITDEWKRQAKAHAEKLAQESKAALKKNQGAYAPFSFCGINIAINTYIHICIKILYVYDLLQKFHEVRSSYVFQLGEWLFTCR